LFGKDESVCKAAVNKPEAPAQKAYMETAKPNCLQHDHQYPVTCKFIFNSCGFCVHWFSKKSIRNGVDIKDMWKIVYYLEKNLVCALNPYF